MSTPTLQIPDPYSEHGACGKRSPGPQGTRAGLCQPGTAARAQPVQRCYVEQWVAEEWGRQGGLCPIPTLTQLPVDPLLGLRSQTHDNPPASNS